MPKLRFLLLPRTNFSRRVARAWALVGLLSLLAACSGGGDDPPDVGNGGPGGDGGTGGDNGSAAPVADFSTTFVSGSTVQFDASPSTVNGNAAYYWSFGPTTSPALGLQVTHQFKSTGEYGVTLAVTDEQGRRATVTKTVVVQTDAMPNLVGLAIADAITVMAAAGPPLLDIRQVVDASQPPGTVVTQYPAPGSSVVFDDIYVEVASSMNSDVYFGKPPVFFLFDPDRQSDLTKVGDLLRVAALHPAGISDYEIAEVVVRMGGHDTPLSFAQRVPTCPLPSSVPCPGYWGDVSFVGQPLGVVTFELRARDVLGNEFVRVYAVIHDAAPQLTVVEPADGSLVLGALRVEVACSDDVACVIALRLNEQLVSLANGVLSGEFPLPGPVDGTVRVSVAAYDQQYQFATRELTVYRGDPQRLELVSTMPGEIVDARDTRLLYVVAAPSGDRLFIHDLADGSDEEIPVVGRSIAKNHAFLLTSGAVFASEPASGGASASLWRAGVLTDLGDMSPVTLQVNGDFAIFSEGLSLKRLDASTAAVDIVTATEARQAAVDADGTVVFADQATARQLHLYDSGVVTPLTNSPSLAHAQPLIDGDSVVFRRSVPNVSSYDIVLLEGTSQGTLATAHTALPEPRRDYAIVDGWIAFTRLGPQLQEHVFVRAPDGTIEQRTQFSTSSRIETLGGEGTLMFVNEGRRYLSFGNAVVSVGSEVGESHLLNGTWHLAVGGALLAVKTD